MNKKLSYMPKSKSQTHLSPNRVFDLIKEKWGYCKDKFYDPCPAYTPYKAPCFFNGLYGNWKSLNYVNSPFDKKTLEKFVIKAYQQSLIGNKTIMLLPTKTDQDWYHDFILKNNFEILWIRKRLKFTNNKHHSTDTHFLVMIDDGGRTEC